MEPTPQQAAEGAIVVKVLAAVLERLVNSNASLALADPGQITKFHALKPPGIGIEAYLERIHKYACCSNECFILALIYIDRLIQRNNFLLTELNVHRVVITAILLAAKFFDDAYYNNAYYSKVGGVLVSEMNGLEVDFLFRINFSLHVHPDVFDKYNAELVAHSINFGMSIAVMSSPLPQISEVESVHSSGMTTPDVTRNQYHLQQHFPEQDSGMQSNTMVAPPAQVTPSPYIEAMGNTLNMPVGPLQPPPAPMASFQPPPASIAPFQNTLYIPGTDQSFVVDLTDSNFGIGSEEDNYQQQQQQQAMIQRAHSLPPLFSAGPRCVDHARYPYHSAPTPMAPALPLINADQEQYQMMINQLFPIQTTLMHHNHTITASHHNVMPTTNSNLHQVYHHAGIQGAGIGASLVSHYL